MQALCIKCIYKVKEHLLKWIQKHKVGLTKQTITADKIKCIY